jgi:uncharacterized protein
MNEELESLLQKISSTAAFLDAKIDDVNQQSLLGDTPLHIVAVWGDTRAAALLIDAGADVNRKGEDGFTPLHHAAAQGHRDLVKLLLERRALRDIQNDEGQKPIDLAGANAEIVKLLRTRVRE